MTPETGLECKFALFGDGLSVTDDARIEGYASLFGQLDQGGDLVAEGAYAASLVALVAQGRSIQNGRPICRESSRDNAVSIIEKNGLGRAGGRLRSGNSSISISSRLLAIWSSFSKLSGVGRAS